MMTTTPAGEAVAWRVKRKHTGEKWYYTTIVPDPAYATEYEPLFSAPPDYATLQLKLKEAERKAAIWQGISDFQGEKWGEALKQRDEAADRLSLLEQQLAQAEAAAYERAAQKADKVLREYEDMDGPRQTVVAAIRALQSREA